MPQILIANGDRNGCVVGGSLGPTGGKVVTIVSSFLDHRSGTDRSSRWTVSRSSGTFKPPIPRIFSGIVSCLASSLH
ncbi:MAG TPA: hypothetical protein DDX19_21455 [Rhodopirellula baltica]|nr:hypothetical protein [Rhodopirellula baltica]